MSRAPAIAVGAAALLGLAALAWFWAPRQEAQPVAPVPILVAPFDASDVGATPASPAALRADSGAASVEREAAAEPGGAETATERPSLDRLPLTLRVHGPDPANLPVAVLWTSLADGTCRDSILWTDAAGEAPVEIQTRGRMPALFWGDVAFPSRGRAARPLPSSGGAVDLPVDGHATLRLLVTEADGSPVLERCTARCRIQDMPMPVGRWHSIPTSAGVGSTQVESGALDLEIEVETASGRRSRLLRRFTFVHGVREDCRLQLDAANALTVQLTDADGRALALAAVTLSAHEGDDPLDGFRHATDTTGRLELFVPAGYRGLESLEVAVRAEHGARVFLGTLRLTAAILSGTESCPPLALAAAPRLAAGRVHDDRGAAYAHARVTAQALTPVPPTGKGEPAPQWRPIASGQTDAEGRFVLWGEAPSELPLRVVARDADRSAAAELTSPDVDVVIELERARRGLFGRRR